MEDSLLRVQERLQELEEEQQEELLKDKPDQTRLDQLKDAMVLRIAAEQKLLRKRDRLEPQCGGEQRGTAPDAGWQAAHLV